MMNELEGVCNPIIAKMYLGGADGLGMGGGINDVGLSYGGAAPATDVAAPATNVSGIFSIFIYFLVSKCLYYIGSMADQLTIWYDVCGLQLV
ncbi:hypothetical protein R6Q57_018452 [Mikania cordata]